MIDLWYLSESDIVELGEALQKFEPRQIDKPGASLLIQTMVRLWLLTSLNYKADNPFTNMSTYIFKPLNMKDTCITGLSMII